MSPPPAPTRPKVVRRRNRSPWDSSRGSSPKIGVLSSSEVPTPRVEAFANETSATLVFFDATPSPSSYEAILSSPRDVVEIRIVHVTRLPTGSPLTSTFTHLSSSTVYTVVVTANYGARRTSNPLVVFVTTLDPLTRKFIYFLSS